MLLSAGHGACKHAPPTRIHAEGPRAVVLIGPPKTGSTHIQHFLTANRQQLAERGWQWPRGVDGAPAGPKSFANLAGALANRTCQSGFATYAPRLLDAILGLCHGRSTERSVYSASPERVLAWYRAEFRRIANNPSAPNLVLSAEDLAYFDGHDATAVRVRSTLRRDLLAPFHTVHMVMVYRQPRVTALYSVFGEDVDVADTFDFRSSEGVRAAFEARRPFSAWLQRVLDNGDMLHKPPWSASLNIGQLADAYTSSGFRAIVINSAGAARDGLDVSDVVACEVLALGCQCGRARWSTYRSTRTGETHYHAVTYRLRTLIPQLMVASGCQPRTRPASAAATRADVDQLMQDGAALRCTNLSAAEELFDAFDAGFVQRYRERTLHWLDGRDHPPSLRTYCELDLDDDATWLALRQMIERKRPQFACLPAPGGGGR